jgi:hypothetical protein
MINEGVVFVAPAQHSRPIDGKRAYTLDSILPSVTAAHHGQAPLSANYLNLHVQDRVDDYLIPSYRSLLPLCFIQRSYASYQHYALSVFRSSAFARISSVGFAHSANREEAGNQHSQCRG